MSHNNYFKAAGLAAMGYLVSLQAQATPLEAAANAVSRMYGLEYKLADYSTQPRPVIKSGLRIDGKANDGTSSFYEQGVNGIQNIKLYSDAKQTKANIAVALDVDEGVYDWRNEQKADASLLIIPDGSSLAKMPQNITFDSKSKSRQKTLTKNDLETTLDLHYTKTIDGKAARGAIFGAGFYVVTTASGAGPAVVAALIETGVDYAGGRMRDRRLYETPLVNVPTKIPQNSIDRLVKEADIHGTHYVLTINVNSKGKYGDDHFQPDAYVVEEINLEKYGGKGHAFQIKSRDHRMRNNIWAFIEGVAAGELYKLLDDAQTAQNAVTGGRTSNGPQVVPPNAHPPVPVTGGVTNGAPQVVIRPTVPPGG